MMVNYYGVGNKLIFVKFIMVYELKLMDGVLFQSIGCIYLLFNLLCFFLDCVIEFDECDIKLIMIKLVFYFL